MCLSLFLAGSSIKIIVPAEFFVYYRLHRYAASQRPDLAPPPVQSDQFDFLCQHRVFYFKRGILPGPSWHPLVQARTIPIQAQKYGRQAIFKLPKISASL